MKLEWLDCGVEQWLRKSFDFLQGCLMTSDFYHHE